MNFLKMLKSCLHPAVIIGVLVVIGLAYIFAPQLAQYSWILIALICPLSMILMMAMMNKKGRIEKDNVAKDDTKL